MDLQQMLLKWVGGKAQILHHLDSFIPDTIDVYVEPFVGGGSVLLHVLRTRTVRHARASDANPYLIQFYKSIQEDPYGLCEHVRSLETAWQTSTDRAAWYYMLRDAFNNGPTDAHTPLYQSAMFLMLNRLGFRGMYREGPNGFNVPYGHYKMPKFLNMDEVLEVHRLIRDVQFTCCTFTVADYTKATFVYMDPPYEKETSTSFTSYVAGTELVELDTLARLCVKLTRDHCTVLLSNSNVPSVHAAFKHVASRVQLVDASRRINAKDPSARTTEVLIFIQ